MTYQEFKPGEALKPYIKHYYVFESDVATGFADTVFPNGTMEIVFNLGAGIWQSAVDEIFCNTPAVELWGQITKPLPIKSNGKHSMLGVRFLPHSAAYFFDNEVSEFNDQIVDLRDHLGPAVRALHERLLEVPAVHTRISLVENFLIARLAQKAKKANKIAMVGRIVDDIKRSIATETVESIASRYDITPRYLQKLFLQCTGVTPKFYSKITRFQQSLQLVNKKDISLTSIAYDCGYFDQSHFIREFKSFTGLVPSAYAPELSPVNQAFANN